MPDWLPPGLPDGEPLDPCEPDDAVDPVEPLEPCEPDDVLGEPCEPDDVLGEPWDPCEPWLPWLCDGLEDEEELLDELGVLGDCDLLVDDD